MAIMKVLLPKTVSSVEDIQNVKLSESLRINVFVFKILGHWLPERSSKWFLPYAIYAAIVIVWIMIMFNISLFVKFYMILDDLEEVAASFYLVSCTALEMIKAYYFLVSRYDVEKIIQSLDREIFVPKTVKQFELVAGVLRFSQQIYLFFIVCIVTTVFFWATYPILDSDERVLPFSSWFPWNAMETPAYELCFFYSVSSAFILAIVNITMDTTASGLMSNICAQLDLLAYNLVNMYEETEMKLRLSPSVEVVSPKDVYEAMYESLEECVQHHRNILELATDVGHVFNISVFYQFLITGATLCMTMFQLTLVRPLSFEFFSLISYQLCISMQIVMYCWFGNEVILRSKHLMNAAFNAPWQDCSPKFKRNLLFLMLRVSKPINLRAGGFFLLSIETFTLIMRSSWSYFVVLRQVHDD